MANLPFSGLVAATTALAADLICISQGGVSKKSTRPIFLTAQPGEAIGLHRSAGTGAIILDATGSIFLNTDAAGQLQVAAVADVDVGRRDVGDA